jgi:hypothetical protein
MPARDEFTKETKDILAKRVGLRCSNPNCRRLTSGPQAHPRKTVNIGVAAHIAAAAPGGPRYDDNMTQEERCDIDNAVWLCQNCAKLIDNDSSRYTTDLLRRWRRLSEEAAMLSVESIPTPTSTASDDDLIRFYASCFDRPAFQDLFHQEGNMEAFDRAIEDTITAPNTGCLRARDGTILQQAKVGDVGFATMIGARSSTRSSTSCVPSGDATTSPSRRERSALDTMTADGNGTASTTTPSHCGWTKPEHKPSLSLPTSARRQAYSHPTAHTFACHDGSHCEWATAEERRPRPIVAVTVRGEIAMVSCIPVETSPPHWVCGVRPGNGPIKTPWGNGHPSSASSQRRGYIAANLSWRNPLTLHGLGLEAQGWRVPD